MNSGPQHDASSGIAERTRRKITRRLMPFLFVLYIISYLDRVNLGYASLETTHELGFSNEVFGFGAGIFFVGYFFLAIPSTILVELWSARKWIGRIMISRGLLASLTGLITTARQLYWFRFFLGMAEAGFFPGIMYYLNHWYRSEDRAKAIAMPAGSAGRNAPSDRKPALWLPNRNCDEIPDKRLEFDSEDNCCADGQQTRAKNI